MPKIPIFQSETKVTTEGPNTLVDAATYGIEGRGQAALWGDIGKAGEKLTTVSKALYDKMDRAAKITELADMKFSATKQLFDGRNEITKGGDPSTYATSFETLGQTIMQNTLQKSSRPDVQAAFQNHFGEHLLTEYHGVMRESRSKQIQQFAGNIDSRGAEYLEFIEKESDPAKKQYLANQFANYVDEGVAGGIILPAKAEKIKKDFSFGIKVSQFSADMNSNAAVAIDRLKSGDYGFDATQVAKAIPQATSAMHRQQSDRYEKVVDGLLNNQMPSGDQMQLLRPTQRKTIDNLVKSMGDETDKGTKVSFAKEFYGLSESDPNIEQKGNELLGRVLGSSGLSSNDKIGFMREITNKKDKSQKISATQDEMVLRRIHQGIGQEYDDFIWKWETSPDGKASITPNMTREERAKTMMEFAVPFREKHVENEVKKSLGKGKKTSNMDRAREKLFPGGGKAKPAGEDTVSNPLEKKSGGVQVYRVFNKKTKQWENNKEVFEMLNKGK